MSRRFRSISVLVLAAMLWTTSVGEPPLSRYRFSATFAQDINRADATDAVQRQQHVVVQGALELTVTVQPIQALVAQPIEMTLQVEAPANASVQMPVITRLGEFTLLDQADVGPLPIENAPSRRRWIRTVTFESLVSGPQTIPSLTVRASLSPGDRELVVHSRQVVVTIDSVLAADAEVTEFQELKPPVEIADVEVSSPVRWAIGVVAGIAVVALLYGLALNRIRRSVSPQQWARENLQRVAAEHRSDRLDPVETYRRLSLLLREFISRSLQIDAAALSSDELIDTLQQHNWSPHRLQMLRQFFNAAEQSRFSTAPKESGEVAVVPFETVRLIIDGHDASPGPSEAR